MPAAAQKPPAPEGLVVVFAPSLWPYRSPLDRVSWMLGQGLANALSLVPGILGYATPRALLDPGVLMRSPPGPIEVLRSLPNSDLVREELDALGAQWAVTGRLLADRKGLELWLNLLGAPHGDLLWTGRIQPQPHRLLWFMTGLVRKLVADGLHGDAPLTLDVRALAPTTSWTALVCLARAEEQFEAWDPTDFESGLAVVRSASRAFALDPAMTRAEAILQQVTAPLVERVDSEPLRAALVEAVQGEHPKGAARALINLAQEKQLALAHRPSQT